MCPLDADDEEDDGFRFSVSKLPSWAKKTISADNEKREGGRGGADDTVSGRWAEVYYYYCSFVYCIGVCVLYRESVMNSLYSWKIKMIHLKEV